MLRDLHLTKEGFRQIVAIKAAMNRGLSDVLKEAFTSVVSAMVRPLIKNKEICDPNLLSGFTSAEGCFYVLITNSNTKIGEKVQLVFQLTQHSRDENLMKSLIKYFGCGNLYSNGNKFSK